LPPGLTTILCSKGVEGQIKRIGEIKEWVDPEYVENHRTTVIGGAEMEQVVSKYMPELFKLRESRVE